ncbi:hypothetical protein LSAT2_018986 [Lamellibrachia satsuma]|nr:hypothetical protein LSAT2_018986 [Lamellibrachia satsuma]
METESALSLWPCLTSVHNCTRLLRNNATTVRTLSREHDQNTTSGILLHAPLDTLDGGSTFVIVVLSVVVLLAVVFTISRLFVKAEAVAKASDVSEVLFEPGEGMFTMNGGE